MRVAVELARLRAKPDDASEQLSQLLRGEPVTVIDQRGDWTQVETAYRYPGWVRESALEEGDGSIELGDGSLIEAARGYLGAPYEWGGMTTAGIDCSGLVHMAHRAAGKLVQRDAWQQQDAAAPVDAPEPGDLAFYGDGIVDHVAIWLGDGRILHATGRDGLGVVEEPEPARLAAGRRGFGRLIPPNSR
jgi:cell wall-associated NlpC family hydrolase